MSLLFTPSHEEAPSDQNPVIKVIGVGGGGGNAVNHMIRQGIKNVEYIAVNTDRRALDGCQAPDRLQLGERGTGAGTDPNVAKEMAIKARDEISERLHKTDMVFITGGMGGGTGSGAAPIIAELAKDLGVLIVAVVTYPFSHEGSVKQKIAKDSINALEKYVNALIVVHNDKLKKELPEKVKMKAAFAAADNVLYNAVSGVSDIITETGYMQVDFADVCTVMKHAGISMMGSATAEGEDRALQAIEKALQSPFLEGIELENARGVLLYIAASEDSLELDEYEKITERARECASEDAVIKSGLVYDDNLGDKIKVTVLITGLAPAANKQNVSSVSLSKSSQRPSDSLPREDIYGNRIPFHAQEAERTLRASTANPPSLSASTFASANDHQTGSTRQENSLPTPINTALDQQALQSVTRKNKRTGQKRERKEDPSDTQQPKLPGTFEDTLEDTYSKTKKSSIPITLFKKPLI